MFGVHRRRESTEELRTRPRLRQRATTVFGGMVTETTPDGRMRY
jgi:hypothetical protein